jgi:hypothetical protein
MLLFPWCAKDIVIRGSTNIRATMGQAGWPWTWKKGEYLFQYSKVAFIGRSRNWLSKK